MSVQTKHEIAAHHGSDLGAVAALLHAVTVGSRSGHSAEGKT